MLRERSIDLKLYLMRCKFYSVIRHTNYSSHWGKKAEKYWEHPENGRSISCFGLEATQSPPVCWPEPYPATCGVGGWLFHTELRSGFSAGLVKICSNSAGFMPMNHLYLFRNTSFFKPDFSSCNYRSSVSHWGNCMVLAISAQRCWLACGGGVKVAHSWKILFSFRLVCIATTRGDHRGDSGISWPDNVEACCQLLLISDRDFYNTGFILIWVEVSGLSSESGIFESQKCVDVSSFICRQMSREWREWCQAVLLEAHFLHGGQGAVAFKVLLFVLAEDKLLGPFHALCERGHRSAKAVLHWHNLSEWEIFTSLRK